MTTVDLLHQVVVADTPHGAIAALSKLGLKPGCYVRVTDIIVNRVPGYKDGVFRISVEVDLRNPVDPSKPILLIQVQT